MRIIKRIFTKRNFIAINILKLQMRPNIYFMTKHIWMRVLQSILVTGDEQKIPLGHFSNITLIKYIYVKKKATNMFSNVCNIF